MSAQRPIALPALQIQRLKGSHPGRVAPMFLILEMISGSLIGWKRELAIIEVQNRAIVVCFFLLCGATIKYSRPADLE